MRNRLERGRLHKAQRGELFHRVPTGYIKIYSDRIEMDPDEQVREVIRLIFDKYDEIGSAWGVFHYLIRNKVRLGFRPFHGPNRGNLEWRRPVLITLFEILRHPIYAGAYAYVRRTRQRARTAKGAHPGADKWVPMEERKVLKRCLPAYITWITTLRTKNACANTDQVLAPRGVPVMAPRCSAVCWSAAPAVGACSPLTGPQPGPITVAFGISMRGPNRCASVSKPR
jgi:hypothetical protein